MELKPAKGLRVRVNASREAIFGEESVEIRKVTFLDDESRTGLMTGITLAGYCEVEMSSLDGKKHWYPIAELVGENWERIVEEEIQIEVDDNEAEEEEQVGYSSETRKRG